MDKINEIISFFKSLTISNLIDFLIAILIVLVFKMLSSAIAYLIVKLFHFKVKNPKRIKSSAFYKPLKLFFILLGVFIGLSILPFSTATLAAIRKIFKILCVILIAKGFSNTFDSNSITYEKLKNRFNIHTNDTVLTFTGKIIKGLIYIIAGFIILTDLGYNLGGLATGLGISSVVIALAAQNVAKSILSGITIISDKPFIIGDYIKVSNFEGTVEDITFRSTRIRDLDNQIVVVPNSVVADSPIVNFSKIEKRRFLSTLTLESETPLTKVSSFTKELQDLFASDTTIFQDSIRVVLSEISNNKINLSIDFFTSVTNFTDFLKFKERINYSILGIIEKYNINLV